MLWIKRKLTVAALIGVAGLAGCTTFGQLNESLDAMMGRDLREAIAALGYPSGQLQLLGDTVYVWSTSSSGAMVLPTSSTTSGTVGTKSFYGTTTGSQVIPYNYACTIKLAVGPDSRLKHWEYDGNMGGCERVIKRLTAYVEAHPS